MTRTQVIALTAGALTALLVLGTALWLMIFGDVFPEKERLVMVFVALGPLAMCSVMVGYAVWWLVMFMLTLLGLHQKRQTDDQESSADD